MIILDTTIRDGSYAVDFKFSCSDVADIISKLEKLGFKYIEIGHGLGLNASSAKYGYSLHSDKEYMLVAQKILKKARFGFFCIPGIARLEDIRLAADNGVSFIRVGINANFGLIEFLYSYFLFLVVVAYNKILLFLFVFSFPYKLDICLNLLFLYLNFDFLLKIQF